jgi:Flp pilus assembly protein TadG
MNKQVFDSRRGQNLVEFALILPIFLLVAVVVLDLGRAVYYYSTIYNAAREGTRYGIIYPNDVSGMESTTIDYAYGAGLEVSDVTAGLGTPQVIDGFPNPTVQVSVTYSFTPVTPFVANLIPGGQITLTSEAVMRTETVP